MCSLFGVLFIGWGLSHLVILYGLEHGPTSTLLFCLVLWSGDIAALYVGRSVGRRPMVPTISPGKTWEGALGGLVGSLLVAILSAWLLSLPMTVYQSLLFGLLISCAAQIGDLAESLLKRYIGVKDSGSLIPGHGGILDRLDSFCLAAPAAAYFFIWLNALTLR
jgi:phosphatidate cytidylyltransferase